MICCRPVATQKEKLLGQSWLSLRAHAIETALLTEDQIDDIEDKLEHTSISEAKAEIGQLPAWVLPPSLRFAIVLC